MDYCTTCRRHLNGALVCPGCGAHTAEFAPLLYGTPAPATPTADTALWPAPAGDTRYDAPAYAAEDAHTQEDPYTAEEGPALPAPMGRAARRRQRVRWKKTQRRALVATAVALVGGGLTVASLDRQSTDRTQAASAPDSEAMGVAEKQVTEPADASSTAADTERSTNGTRSATRSSTANSPHEQSATTPQATPTAQTVQQDTLASTVAGVTSTVESTASDVTESVTETTATATPSATATATDSGTDTSSASPAPTATETESSQLCLLVICLG